MNRLVPPQELFITALAEKGGNLFSEQSAESKIRLQEGELADISDQGKPESCSRYTKELKVGEIGKLQYPQSRSGVYGRCLRPYRFSLSSGRNKNGE